LCQIYFFVGTQCRWVTQPFVQKMIRTLLPLWPSFLLRCSFFFVLRYEISV
jgi:hypothetical protein